MARWDLVWPVWAVMAVHVIAIFIFTKGFLLTRTELPYYSQCSDVSQSPCLIPDSVSHPIPTSSSSSLPRFSPANLTGCWTKPAVDRLVIIVLDALRFDFVAPSTFFEGDTALKMNLRVTESKPWMDKLKVLHRMASTRGSSVRIFKAIADPPTTSLQRLKGLTTGGLPTFIDVGNSFGTPAIIEDNLIHELVQNGKRVVMMGDDTWMQLFPDHFKLAFPYPSFNVKDLHTVDNGCIEHIFPALNDDGWDVLIAHFLGVDHAGHIFGVDSIPMIEKLEQYNAILEQVIDVLVNKSGPGGSHENTLLLVMGDHGQTMNGDHGGGSAEEVETTIVAMNFKESLSFTSLETGATSCKPDLDGKEICISSIQQLDFSVTVSALLGIPFPFGSIGRINFELYTLGSHSSNYKGIEVENCVKQLKIEEAMENYVNALCINSWQVKRYIDVYSSSSLIGFSREDLSHITNMYAEAMQSWLLTTKNLLFENKYCNETLPDYEGQIDAFSNFLTSVAELARSKWTEFNLKMMSLGFGLMLSSLFVHLLAIKWMNKQCNNCFSVSEGGLTFGLFFACFMVATRACSFLSNSYILEEGKVATFILATTGIFKLRYSIMKKTKLFEATVFLFLMIYSRFTIEIGLSKQAATSAFLKAYPSWVLGITSKLAGWMYLSESMPLMALTLLVYLLHRAISSSTCKGIWKFVICGAILSCFLTGLHWAMESKKLNLMQVVEGLGKNFIPRVIYVIGFVQLSVLAFDRLFMEEKSLECRKTLLVKTVAALSAWSSTIFILAGKQGPLIALASILGGYCIMRLENIEQYSNEEKGIMNVDVLSITQWNFFAVSLFFCTGHWCAFDGLRYGAAFIGFDEFVLVRQAILLTIDTFGFSIILPLLGFPILLAKRYPLSQSEKGRAIFFMRLSQAYLIYGLISATTVTATILCVIIQRRHLMVWGLFAPKFVFDVVGLILSDIFICVATLYYLGPMEDDKKSKS